MFFNRIIQPQCLGGLISYFSPDQTQISANGALCYAFGIVLCSLIPVLVFHPFFLYVFTIGLRIRIGCCSLLYKKVRAFSFKYLQHYFKAKITSVTMLEYLNTFGLNFDRFLFKYSTKNEVNPTHHSFNIHLLHY